MRIRQPVPDDVALLARVHVDSWRAAYRGIVPDAYLAALDVEKRAARFRDSLASRAEETHVIEADGAVLGFVTFGAYRDTDVERERTGEVWGIYLDPRHWRRGIGTRLCRHVEDVLRRRGCADIVLWVFERNDAARAFYEAMGYSADGGRKTIMVGEERTAVRYRKPLTLPEGAV